MHMARFCSVERMPSCSPDETLPTRCHTPTSYSRCPSRCHTLSLSPQHAQTALMHVATLWPHDETAHQCPAAFGAAPHCGTMMLCRPRRLCHLVALVATTPLLATPRYSVGSVLAPVPRHAAVRHFLLLVYKRAHSRSSSITPNSFPTNSATFPNLAHSPSRFH